ncbi:MAG: hypothetical protein GY863_05645 [bacterium]|nr:hypothetical protein [bacterium]
MDSKDDMMRTPFFYAQSSNNMAIIRKLISLGAEINIVDKNGGSPLLFALEKFCDQKIVNLLLEEGTTVNVEGEQGRILLHKAAAGGYVNLVVILLDKGADILTNNKTGGTLLHSAAAGGLTELVSNLLDSGFHIDSVDELNRTPLHIAEDRGNSDTEELLKERGAADIPRKTFSLDDRDKAANRSNAEYLKTEQVEVSYIANSGFLVKCGDKKILIDAMHRYFYYMPTPSASLAKMNNSQPPFDNIDVLLITHPDADHFDPAMILTFLSLNPDTKMIGSTLTCDKLREYGEEQYEKIKSQIIEADLDFGSSADFSVSGIGIKALGLDHGGNYLNLGFVIDLDETKLIHLGDMSPAASMKYFENFQLREENIDIAFSSYAFGFDTGYQKILSDYIHPKYNIAMHIQSDLVERVEREFKDKFPNTIVFRETMQKVIFRK